jgi:hypothetical protein
MYLSGVVQGTVACMALVGKHRFEDLVMDGRILLKWMLMRFDGRVWTGLMWF